MAKTHRKDEILRSELPPTLPLMALRSTIVYPLGTIAVQMGSPDNLALLRAIGSFEKLRVPVLVGASRKRFIGQLTGVDDPTERLEGTAGAVAWCAANGVDVVRVHDVRAMARVVQVVDAIARDGRL